MEDNHITGQIIDAAFKIHTRLGPGLFESVYEAVLAYELERRGLRLRKQQALPVVYEAVRLARGYRIDLLVEDRVIVEVKSIDAIAQIHVKQLLTYLRLADKRVGLLLNFGACLMKDGIRRVVNDYAA
jgi:GxxExxY protein